MSSAERHRFVYDRPTMAIEPDMRAEVQDIAAKAKRSGPRYYVTQLQRRFKMPNRHRRIVAVRMECYPGQSEVRKLIEELNSDAQVVVSAETERLADEFLNMEQSMPDGDVDAWSKRLGKEIAFGAD